jgi:hypothetical protein
MTHSVCSLAPVNETDITLCGETMLVQPVGPEGCDPSCVVCLDLERVGWCPHGDCLLNVCTRGAA